MVFVEDDIVRFLKVHCDFFVGRKIPNVYFKNIVLDALPDSEPLTKKHIDKISTVC